MTTATDLLGHARGLVSEVSPGTNAVWSRAAALLGRMALEQSVRTHVATLDDALPEASMRAQLLCLPYCVAPALATRASVAWSGLSRACHVHPYELAPTGAELAWWLEVVGELERAGGRGAAGVELAVPGRSANWPALTAPRLRRGRLWRRRRSGLRPEDCR